MKKNIVFIIPSLDAGGAEKSLINLLSVFDYSTYNVDLIMFNKSGLFLNLLPKEVTIIEIKENYPVFALPFKEALLQFIKQLKFKLAFNRFIFTLKNNLIKNKAIAEQASWKNSSIAIPNIKEQYDVAIAFLEKSSIYFLVDKITAKKKIAYIHNDYNKLRLNKDFDSPYFEKLNFLITVSDECGKILKETFSNIANKIVVIFNIVSKELIYKLSNETQSTGIKSDNISILSIGRLHPQKGFDLAVDACEVLIKKGFNVKWYVIGEGNERKSLEVKIAEKNLSQNFYLLGLKENPYPYLKEATIFVQSSIKNEYNGLVVPMNGEGIANGVQRIIEDTILREELIKNLKKEEFGTEIEIEKVYQLIES